MLSSGWYLYLIISLPGKHVTGGLILKHKLLLRFLGLRFRDPQRLQFQNTGDAESATRGAAPTLSPPHLSHLGQTWYWLPQPQPQAAKPK